MQPTNGQKIMKTSLALIIYVVCMCEATAPGTSNKEIPKDKTFIDMIKADKNECITIAFLYNSMFTKTCSSRTYPFLSTKSNQEITKQDLLCLGLHDASRRMCYFGSKKQLVREIPSNSSEFDEQLKKMQTVGNFKDQVCEMLHTPKLRMMLNSTEVEQVTKILGSVHECNKFCFRHDDEVEPLCTVLAWINQLTVNIMNPVESSTSTVSPATTKKVENVSAAKTSSATSSVSEPVKKIDTHETPEDNQLRSNTAGNDTLETQPAVNKNDSHITNAENAPKTINVTVPNTNKAQSETPNVSRQPNKNAQGISTNRFSEDPNNVNSKPNTNADKHVADDMSGGDKHSNTGIISQEESNPDLQLDDSGEGMDAVNLKPAGESSDNSENSPVEPNENHNDQEKSEEIMPVLMRRNDDDESHFLAYFMAVSLLCIAGYVGYHNKQKILAIVLEGRRSKGGRGRRRPNTAGYRKLDCTLEEAVTSQCNSNVTHVIY